MAKYNYSTIIPRLFLGWCLCVNSKYKNLDFSKVKWLVLCLKELQTLKSDNVIYKACSFWIFTRLTEKRRDSRDFNTWVYLTTTDDLRRNAQQTVLKLLTACLNRQTKKGYLTKQAMQQPSTCNTTQKTPILLVNSIQGDVIKQCKIAHCMLT